MISKLFFGISLLLGTTTVFPVQAEEEAASTSGQQQSILADIESYLNKINTLTATFSQTNPDKTISTGKFYLKRKTSDHYGKLRLEYNPPVRLLVVANGELLMQHDLESDEVNSYSIDSTPAAFLLEKNISFTKNTTVKSVRQEGNKVIITLAKRGDDDSSSLTLVLLKSSKGYELKDWTVLDAQGNATFVQLSNVTLGGDLKDSLFEVNR
jgi:outer membrane lipoprotein-sorting protein